MSDAIETAIDDASASVFTLTAQKTMRGGERIAVGDATDLFANASPQAELHFKLYRQSTDQVVAIADATAAFLDGFFA